MKKIFISILMMCGVFQNGTSFINAQTAIDRGLNSINRVLRHAIWLPVLRRLVSVLFMVIVIFNLLKLMRRKDNRKELVGKYILIR